jgi:hypothetical protein
MESCKYRSKLLIVYSVGDFNSKNLNFKKVENKNVVLTVNLVDSLSNNICIQMEYSVTVPSVTCFG